jgi:YVTN family beta-propeller protein
MEVFIMGSSKICIYGFLLACLGCTNGGGESGFSAKSSQAVCAPESVTEEGYKKAGSYGQDEAILPNGRRLTPVGTRIETGGVFPLGFRVNRAETRAYVVHNGDDVNGLVVLDLEQGKRIQSVSIKSPFRAVALSPDEKTLYVGSGKHGKLYFFDVLEDGRVQQNGELFLGGYLADIEVSPSGDFVYVVANTNSNVYVVDTATRQVVKTFKVGTYPYDMVLSKDGQRLFVSNLSSSTVQVLDTSDGTVLASIKVGKNPSALALSKDEKRLFVACSDSDVLSVIDTQTYEETKRVELSDHPLLLKHGSVNGVTVSPDGALIFVSQANFNRIDVLDAETFERKGAIPTGWYPTDLFAGNQRLYAVSSKGMGSKGPTDLKRFGSFLQVIPYPSDETLETWTNTVEENNNRTLRYFDETCDPSQIPVLSGKDSPIKHVVLIVRENKTYDMDLGDLEGTDGDPNMVLWGEEYTPNLHKLARQFVNMDNFYSNAEASVQGHMWTTQAHCNDYTEKTYWDQWQLPGYEAASVPESGTIFSHLFAHGVSFRNYGEFPSFGPGMFEEFMDFFDNKYPFWTMEVPDVDKASEIIREINLGIFPQFVYAILPNDHTYGSRAGKPTPRSLVMDNDLATGMLVEAISKSPYWPETAIFLIEDDPQGTGDHVEAHRSICIVISPWVKRGYLSSVHYDVPSLYRTIELILGVPPIGRNDAMAPPMLDIWVDGVTEQPDYTPFDAIYFEIPKETNPDLGELSRAVDHCDFEKIDQCPGLGMVLWRMMKGDIPLPPYAKWIDD